MLAPIPKPTLWQRFRAVLKSDSVRLYVWPYWIAICLWGVYGTFFAVPNTVIEPVMGHWVYNIWIWACIIAPASAMLGMLLVRRLRPSAKGKDRFFGEAMQMGGNVGIGFVLAAFEYSAIVGTPWGRGSMSVFLVVPYILGCTFLALRNALELYEAEWEQA